MVNDGNRIKALNINYLIDQFKCNQMKMNFVCKQSVAQIFIIKTWRGKKCNDSCYFEKYNLLYTSNIFLS